MLRALPLLVLYTIRSERRLREELGYHLRYRWFVGWGMNEDRWDAPTFTNNRERFIDGEVARRFFAEVLAAADAESLVSAEHFSVDGTLVEAWASRKSVRPKQESAAAPAPPPNSRARAGARRRS